MLSTNFKGCQGPSVKTALSLKTLTILKTKFLQHTPIHNDLDYQVSLS